MFTEADRVKIRVYAGYSLFIGKDFPSLEYAITQAQSIADGGEAPDNSTELYIKQLLVELEGIDSKLKEYRCYMQTVMVDGKMHVDPVRATQMLKMEGRRLVARLMIVLGFNQPNFDSFSSMVPFYP